MTMKNKTAIAGIGATPYYKRGTAESTLAQLACEAILAACADAGISSSEIDGFSSYSEEVLPHFLAPALGIPAMRYSSTVWGGGGGGSCAAIGNASAAIAAGFADVIVLYHAVRRTEAKRFGGEAGFARHFGDEWASPFGLMTPAQSFALIVRRHMHEYGTSQEQFGALAITQREHALRNPLAMMQKSLTMEDYLASRMITDPFRLFDCTLENDGACALIVTSAERARDLRQPPAYVAAVAQGGPTSWSNPLYDHNAAPDVYPTAGHGTIARDLYAAAGAGPDDIDVAQLYDHFSGMVLLQLEDYGFCGRGESGPFVADGGVRWAGGRIPVNTHGGNLSEVNLHGTTHLIEGVRQIRGTSTSQVVDAELCLVTGGPSPTPSSSMILSRSA
jgi:acetyl-CoA acetyltransferase